MTRSIKRQMIICFTGLVIFVMLAFVVMNGNFLEQYYVANKQKELTTLYKELNSASKNKTLSDEEAFTNLAQMAEKANTSFVIIDEKNAMALTNVHDDERLQMQLTGYLLNQNQKRGELLKNTKNYQIQKTTDPKNQLEYIEMWGDLPNSYTFILRSPLESIRESVSLSNQFLGYVGIAVVFISILFVWYFSKRITDPILELAALSQKMANLDFDAKYKSGGENEIGILGTNFNAMSQKLELAISDLKRANHELQRDIEKKEQIEEMRTEFLGNVSHELKTPIALIQGYAEGLKEGVNTDAESREFYCDVIMDEANKMNMMVKNLLTLNQLEFGNEEVQFERFDIVDLIRGVIQSMDILIQQKGVDIHFCQQEPVYVWADEFKAEQVVRNYLSNALNHVDEHKVIDIKILVNEKSAKVSVFNTGKPIPEEDVDRIWDKFYKVDKARTREYGGNGIGLSIVKAIMESFHHNYGLKNYDNGVEFWFELDVQ